MNGQDPRLALARRLRALRETHWPGKRVNQAQLAAALSEGERGSASVPLISSWESRRAPKAPPESRIKDIATFFASTRSLDGNARLLSPDEMTEQELAARDELLQELVRLRAEAISDAQEGPESLNSGPYRIEDRGRITIVCAQLPQDMLRKMPYADPHDPDFIELYRYSDLDSLVELFGHLRATNPTGLVRFRPASQLSSDEYRGHLVLLGGVDWNDATGSVLDRLQLPVKQVSRLDEDDDPGVACFEVTDVGGPIIHRPWLGEAGGRRILREDVALFARAVSPYNRKRRVTICNGMYGSGTYGVVCALTDEGYRDRNAQYLQDAFGDSDAFCLLSRVTVENGKALTPDWTLPETRLFEWSKP